MTSVCQQQIIHLNFLNPSQCNFLQSRAALYHYLLSMKKTICTTIIGLISLGVYAQHGSLKPLNNEVKYTLLPATEISHHYKINPPKPQALVMLIALPTEEQLTNSTNKQLMKTNYSAPAQAAFFTNRRNVYSSLWAFASLNYLYADLVGLMDKNKLNQYQLGVVEGVNITPEFLTVAAIFMQIPIANVFLPQVIKNDKTLKWVQIVSGSVMTLVQAGTLFMGKPAPYYVAFSGFEIAATTFITINAIKWNINSSNK